MDLSYCTMGTYWRFSKWHHVSSCPRNLYERSGAQPPKNLPPLNIRKPQLKPPFNTHVNPCNMAPRELIRGAKWGKKYNIQWQKSQADSVKIYGGNFRPRPAISAHHWTDGEWVPGFFLFFLLLTDLNCQAII